MDTILISVTGISLAIAASMGVVIARMLRDERRRSEARVQLLGELAGIESLAPVQTTAVTLDEIELRPATRDPRAVPDLFHEHEEPSAWPRRFAVIGAMAAVLFVSVLGYRQLGSSGGDAQQAVAPAAAPQAVAAPLELVALRHTDEGGVLTVSGMVQNPRTAATVARIHATVIVFGPGGSFIASGRAPLDFTSLAPGDESPFVIRVPVTGTVERYRVGFRGADDRMLAHVDRRSADTVAQKQVP